MARTPRCAPAIEGCRIDLHGSNGFDGGFIVGLCVNSPIAAAVRWEVNVYGRGPTVVRALGDAYRQASAAIARIREPGIYVVTGKPAPAPQGDPVTAVAAPEPETVPLFGTWRPTT